MKCNLEFDSYFGEVPKLKWFPWVGQNYGQNSKLSKLLIVGESHYLQRGNDISKFEESVIKHNDRNFTRIIIDEMSNKSKLKTFKNLNSIFQCKGNQSIDDFYSNVSFYNFIQEPVDHIKIRPSDFHTDWNVFKSIVQIIKPDICVFIGTQALKTLKDYRDESELDIELLRFLPKIDHTFPGLLSFHIDGRKINCVAIKHTSRVYKPAEWSKFISNQLFIDINKFH